MEYSPADNSSQVASAEAPPVLSVRDVGLQPFNEIWNLQRSLQQALIRGEGVDSLLLCQHFPVITAGTSTKNTSLVSDAGTLARSGVEFVKVERGGDITYHGPGQLVVYPIIDLRKKRRDVHWYMRTLEEVIIRTLQHFGIASARIPGRTGVWMQATDITEESSVATHPARKIASIGVRISRWCTMHGFAVNVLDVTQGFSHVQPCGFDDIVVTSMAQEQRTKNMLPTTAITVSDVTPIIIREFCSVFGFVQTSL